MKLKDTITRTGIKMLAAGMSLYYNQFHLDLTFSESQVSQLH